MSDFNRQYFNELIPESERNELNQALDLAEKFQWTSMGYWTGDEPTAVDDLVGVHPKKGFGFIRISAKDNEGFVDPI